MLPEWIMQNLLQTLTSCMQMNRLAITSNLFVAKQTANNCCHGVSSIYAWITFTVPLTCNKLVNECSFSMVGSILRWACEDCDSNDFHHLIHTLCRGMFTACDEMHTTNRFKFLLLYPRSQLTSMLRADAVPMAYISSLCFELLDPNLIWHLLMKMKQV